ncbi:MAG: hypothetical protein IKP86_08385 [Anaerolineaceae bacterium]|nr:hypothetical protein [Anaerolineaceae bacterium]
MKKIFATLFALMIALCLMTTAFAQETVTVNWEDIDIESIGIEGSFYSFEDVAVIVWIPDVLENLELTQEDADNGLIGKFEAADGSAGVYVQFIEGGEGWDISSVLEIVQNAGGKDIETVVLNGIDAVSYTIEEVDSNYIAMVSDSGNVLQFIFMPASDEDFSAVTALIAASIQPEE